MINSFVGALDKIFTLTEPEKNAIKETVEVKKFSKGEHLLKEGEISKAFFFNLSGFVRLYYIKEGEEKTANFYASNQFISAYSSFVHQIPSEFYFQATEDTYVIEISVISSQQLLAISPKFDAIARHIMEEELASYQAMVAALLTQKPEERYVNLLEKAPEIFQKVPQHQIASYIGVAPESLSRIKKRYFDKT